MIERRTPRGHEQAAIGPDPEGAPPVTAVLVEHLTEKFPVRLSDRAHPDNVANDQAELRGQQQVIDYLRTISQSNS